MRVTDWARSKVDCINSKSVLINRMSDWTNRVTVCINSETDFINRLTELMNSLSVLTTSKTDWTNRVTVCINSETDSINRIYTKYFCLIRRIIQRGIALLGDCFRDTIQNARLLQVIASYLAIREDGAMYCARGWSDILFALVFAKRYSGTPDPWGAPKG